MKQHYPHVVDQGASVLITEDAPVAWMHKNSEHVISKHWSQEFNIPLYTRPQKYCPSENNAAYEKGFIEGMAKQRDSAVQRFVEGCAGKGEKLSESRIKELEYEHIDIELFDEGEYGMEYNIYGIVELVRAVEKEHGIE